MTVDRSKEAPASLPENHAKRHGAGDGSPGGTSSYRLLGFDLATTRIVDTLISLRQALHAFVACQSVIMGVAARAWKLGALSVSLLANAVVAAEPTVKVLNGTYEGVYLPSFKQDIFLGIPYAQSTGNENRFRPPQSLNTTWNGTRPAKEYGPACPDPQLTGDAISEDCLSINIRPAGLSEDAYSKLPVAVWIHGGM
jgi:hypothetical protein